MKTRPWKRIFSILASMCLLLAQTPVQAESSNDVVVIVGKASKAQAVSKAQVARIFNREISSINGQRVTPVNAKMGSALRKAFIEKVYGRSPVEEVTYWQNAKIRKGTNPPSELGNTVKGVFAIKGGISYCFRKDFNPSVARILLIL